MECPSSALPLFSPPLTVEGSCPPAVTFCRFRPAPPGLCSALPNVTTAELRIASSHAKALLRLFRRPSLRPYTIINSARGASVLVDYPFAIVAKWRLMLFFCWRAAMANVFEGLFRPDGQTVKVTCC